MYPIFEAATATSDDDTRSESSRTFSFTRITKILITHSLNESNSVLQYLLLDLHQLRFSKLYEETQTLSYYLI